MLNDIQLHWRNIGKHSKIFLRLRLYSSEQKTLLLHYANEENLLKACFPTPNLMDCLKFCKGSNHGKPNTGQTSIYLCCDYKASHRQCTACRLEWPLFHHDFDKSFEFEAKATLSSCENYYN